MLCQSFLHIYSSSSILKNEQDCPNGLSVLSSAQINDMMFYVRVDLFLYNKSKCTTSSGMLRQ